MTLVLVGSPAGSLTRGDRTRAGQRSGAHNYHESMGELRTHLGRFEEAKAFFGQGLGLVLQAQGHTAEAAQSFQTAIDLDPHFLEAQQNLDLLQALN